MPYLVLEFNIQLPIADMNGNQNQSTKAHESLNSCIDLIAALNSGSASGTVKIVSKDAATTIDTSGSGSQSNTFTF